MVNSYFMSSLDSGKYVLNEFNIKPILDGLLLTTESGGWVFLKSSEFKEMLSGKLDLNSPLFSELVSKGIIITESNVDMIRNRLKAKIDSILDGPSLHIIIPTLRCNQKCVYCHSSVDSFSKDDKDMDEETYKKTVDFIFQTPAKGITIEFQGGDSTMSKELFKNIVLYSLKKNELHQKSLSFSVVTNLTYLDHDFTEFVIRHNIHLCSSLDGPKEVHNSNRCFECGFSKNANTDGLLYPDLEDNYLSVVETKKVLFEDYGVKVPFLMVTTKKSLSYPKEIVDEYVRQGQQSIQLKYLSKLGFADVSWDNIGYTFEEFLEFWKKALDYILELNKKGTFISERYCLLVLKKIVAGIDPKYLDLRSPCGMVIGQIAYNYNGDIYACDEGRNFEEFKIGNVKTHTLKDVFSSDKVLNLINSSILDNYSCSTCVYKPYCGVCPVLSYAETGNLVPKMPINSRCRFHKFVFDYVFEKILSDESARKIMFDWLKRGNV